NRLSSAREVMIGTLARPTDKPPAFTNQPMGSELTAGEERRDPPAGGGGCVAPDPPWWCWSAAGFVRRAGSERRLCRGSRHRRAGYLLLPVRPALRRASAMAPVGSARRWDWPRRSRWALPRWLPPRRSPLAPSPRGPSPREALPRGLSRRA